MAGRRGVKLIIPIAIAAIGVFVLIEHHRVAQAWELVAEAFAGCPEPAGTGSRGTGFLVIGHRGAAARAVENTLPSMEQAVREGADALEVDLSMTADGEIVLWHDWDPNGPIAHAREKGTEPDVLFRPHFPSSTSGFRKSVSQLTLAEVRTHFGYRLKEEDSMVRAHIPTLAEFLAWTGSHPSIRYLFLDVKVPEEEIHLAARFITTVDSIIRRAQPLQKIVFLVPTLPLLDSIGRYHSGGNLSYDAEPPIGVVLEPCDQGSVPAAAARRNRFASMIAPGAKTLAPFTTLRRIAECDLKRRAVHERNGGVPIEAVIVSTVNDPEEQACLIGLGMDGIITDKPAELRKLVDGMRVQVE